MNRVCGVLRRSLIVSCLICLVPSAAVTGHGPGPLEIGVFLRSTGQDDPARALEAVKSLGLDLVQVSRLPDRFYTPEGAKEFAGMLKRAGIRAA